jgi:hypothetical protein
LNASQAYLWFARFSDQPSVNSDVNGKLSIAQTLRVRKLLQQELDEGIFEPCTYRRFEPSARRPSRPRSS